MMSCLFPSPSPLITLRSGYTRSVNTCTRSSPTAAIRSMLTSSTIWRAIVTAAASSLLTTSRGPVPCAGKRRHTRLGSPSTALSVVLLRETPHLRTRLSLMAYSRVLNNEICFDAKEAYNLYEMFHTRYSLFKQVVLSLSRPRSQTCTENAHARWTGREGRSVARWFALSNKYQVSLHFHGICVGFCLTEGVRGSSSMRSLCVSQCRSTATVQPRPSST